MAIKKNSHNAQLIKGLLRTFFGAAFLAGLWFLLGWALASRNLGFALAAWSLVVGPLLLPPLFWLKARVGRRRLRRFDFAADAKLAAEYFRGILSRPGPRLRLWTYPSRGLSLFWYEQPMIRGGLQELIVSEGWLELPIEARLQDWKHLWAQIVTLTPHLRRLRSLQIALWMGALSPLEFLSRCLQFAFRLAGFGDLPSLGFFLQRFCWSLKSLWFGERQSSGPIPKIPESRHFSPPPCLDSLIWGVWHQIPRRYLHPLWTFLGHQDLQLELSDFEAPL